MKTLTHLALSCAFTLATAAVPGWAASPQTMKPDELAALLEKAETPEEHLKLAHHYSSEAEQLEQEAKSHDALADRYQKSKPTPKVAPVMRSMTKHCHNLAQSLRNAAKAARQLAQSHEAMASELKK